MHKSALSAAFLLLFARSIAAQPYVAQPLATAPGADSCQAFQSTESGLVVGDCSVSGLPRAVVWNAGVPSLLPLPAGYNSSQGLSINEAGTVVGRCTEPFPSLRSNACLWTGGSVQELATPTGVSSSAQSINESGVVAGSVDGWATVWTAGVPLTIPSAVQASAFDINDVGQVTVLSNNGAAVWHVPTGSVTPVVSPLGATGPVVANGINNKGNLSGWAEFADGLRPFRWIDGVPEPLEIPASSENSAGLGINDDDDVTGYVRVTGGPTRGAVWRDAQLTFLSEQSSVGNTINSLGVVAGRQGFVAHLFVPADQVAVQIAGLVEDLVDSDDLDANDAAALQSQLEAAAERIDAGDIGAGIKILRAFNNRVAALVRSHRLAEADALTLLAASNALIAVLEGS